MGLIVDASVAVKWVAAEADSERALPIRQKEIFVPDLFFAEVGNILWKKVRLGELTRAECLEAGDLISHMPMQIVPIRPLLPTALSLSLDLDHPAYDLFYVALALDLGLPFVTADARLIAQVGKVAPPWAATVVPLAAFTPA